MIRRNPSVPTNILELPRAERIGDYARAHGAEIVRSYEDLSLIYFPYFPLELDLAFWRSVKFSEAYKKIGTLNGIHKSLFIKEAGRMLIDEAHPLLRGAAKSMEGYVQAGYMQGEVAHVSRQIHTALVTLFPHYFSLREVNITWRLTPTQTEPMHMDTFLGVNPVPEPARTPEAERTKHRIKLFINIDAEPRKWRVSWTLPEALKRYRSKLPDSLPDDAGLVAREICFRGCLDDAPYHEVEIPPMGAVAAESAAVAHQVVYGNRMIGAEFLCEARDMLSPGKGTFAALPGWLREAGIAVTP